MCVLWSVACRSIPTVHVPSSVPSSKRRTLNPQVMEGRKNLHPPVHRTHITLPSSPSSIESERFEWPTAAAQAPALFLTHRARPSPSLAPRPSARLVRSLASATLTDSSRAKTLTMPDDTDGTNRMRTLPPWGCDCGQRLRFWERQQPRLFRRRRSKEARDRRRNEAS